METYKKALLLLKQFVSEIPADELTELLKKHKGSHIEGPTYSEYMSKFQHSYENINWYSIAEEINLVDLSRCNVYHLSSMDGYGIPPPIPRKNISNNQGSTIIVEPFFFSIIAPIWQRHK